MTTYSSDRRALLKIFGAIGATCAYPFASEELYAQATAGEHQHAPPAAPAQPEAHFFNTSDFAMLSRIADLIIPETDTPGAVSAGAPAYIDSVVARSTDHQLVVADGLRWLDAEAHRIGNRKFIDLSEEEQLSILEPLCDAADHEEDLPRGRNLQFFLLVKSLTADGYYTSRIGLLEELKYQGNKALPIFPNC